MIGTSGLKIRRQVRHFKDFAYNLMDETLDTDLERLCQNVHKERLSRGDDNDDGDGGDFNDDDICLISDCILLSNKSSLIF